ncbi:unnamed protein product [Heterotrigona itama]|uniref:Uncharacterized protein n=1 Tax=Heterotrigona itama TaxID=395501 RepID=A0A6V7H9G1_9HYME|nr:unnamed protein product [Heterotrigona itama]
MDKKAASNRTNQCNPNHTSTGQGHKSGYYGTGTKADLDNHANQLNPNNQLYKKASRSFHQTTASATLILLKLTCELCGLLRPWKTLDYYN